MALTILCWVAANLVIATAWTAYCLWPRRSSADASMDGVQQANELAKALVDGKPVDVWKGSTRIERFDPTH